MEHNYGLDKHVVQYTPWSGDPIRVEKPYKKVILTNAGDCKDRITVSHVTARLQGMGWHEWEALLADWLVTAVVEAIRNGKTEADVTKLFTCDLLGEDRLGQWTKTQDRVVDFLMGRLFECLEEDEATMRVRIVENAID